MITGVRWATLIGCASGQAAAWSFASFLEGEWDLQRVRAGVFTQAQYALRWSDDRTVLAGDYFEYTGRVEDEASHTNRMHVRVTFSDEEQLAGSFELAKATSDANAEDWDDDFADTEPPTPKPAPEPKPVFQFDFTPRNNGAFWLSESRWLGSSGGKLQFVVMGRDAFVISQFSSASSGTEPLVSTWTALRRGADALPSTASGSSADKPKKKSLLSRFFYSLIFLIAVTGWRVYKQKR
eukprot:CAMPEP_0119311678 /NCGR_PEP_ID=MMETSP1333-20130426/23392_1 /TAXON_ID=418940 /ORGANISM="Scyphosphaera apsteinii, Strain RCC1455" /LENGTH=237 /DNA_ID=CAMNT_0007316119 /DNA_START=12 /DNA_END=725 /DNA_ORIENTATION=+